MTFEMTIDEMEMLKKVVEERVKQLAVEIHRTEARSYREALERMQQTLMTLNERFSSVLV